MKSLIKYVEDGGVLETHDDIPDMIREQLYTEEQQRLEKKKKKKHYKGTNLFPAETPSIRINNILPTESHASTLAAPVVSVVHPPFNAYHIDDLKIPGPREMP